MGAYGTSVTAKTQNRRLRTSENSILNYGALLHPTIAIQIGYDWFTTGTEHTVERMRTRRSVEKESVTSHAMKPKPRLKDDFRRPCEVKHTGKELRRTAGEKTK